ncbi:MAG: LPS assembly protein LptD, partial [Ectothiorhodospiraceae bacterium]
LERADQSLSADALRYDETGNRADARGDIRYQQQGLRLGADQGYLNLADDSGAMDATRYLVPEALIQGTASRMRLVDADTQRAFGTTYSTCRPGDEAWTLHAERIRLDQETGTGEAWHARLNVGDFPVAYTPYINFPIDDRRKSGLLPPTIGQSERNGFDYTQPYYWNIAPQVDATLTPRYLSQRGVMLGGELRYLQPSFSGAVEGNYLPDDDQRGDDRWQLGLDQQHRLPGGVRGTLDIARVSDDDYFRDLGDSLRTSTTRNLRSRGVLRYNTRRLGATLDAETYQTLDPDIADPARPFRRLPRLQLDYRAAEPGPAGLRWQVDSEVVRFDHPSDRQRITGTRTDIAPRVSLPFRSLAGFFTPAVTLRHTEYDLDNAEDPRSGGDAVDDENPSRTLPLASLDTGLFFQRNFQAFGQSLRQTLEPRLFYLYVPERDQEDLPLFDTGRPADGIFQLFSTNRFSGADRVGDANQVTTGLTSRFVDRETGSEYLRLGLAQIQYFADRDVVLRGEPGVQERRERSNVIGEARARLGDGFTASTQAEWDPLTDRTTRNSARLSYQPGPERIVSASVRARRNNAGELELDQRNVAAAWPLSPRWHVLGGWRYSNLEERTLEGFGGLQYRDCCWSVRVIGRYFREEPDVEPERSVMLQFQLRGLGTLGDDIQSFLQDSIFGYGRGR